jgi:hypothetical protein
MMKNSMQSTQQLVPLAQKQMPPAQKQSPSAYQRDDEILYDWLVDLKRASQGYFKKLPALKRTALTPEIGRASCRERVFQPV